MTWQAWFYEAMFWCAMLGWFWSQSQCRRFARQAHEAIDLATRSNETFGKVIAILEAHDLVEKPQPTVH